MKTKIQVLVVFGCGSSSRELLQDMSELYNADYDVKLDNGFAIMSKEFDELPSEIPLFKGSTTFVTRLVNDWPEQKVYSSSKGWTTLGGFDPVPELMQIPPCPAGWDRV